MGTAWTHELHRVQFRLDLKSLLKRYHTTFPDETSRHELLISQLHEAQDLSSRVNMRGHVTTSATVLNVNRTKVLLIHHKVFGKWLPPGGHFEHPGTLWQSAAREVAEETGLVRIAPHPWMSGTDLPVDIDSHFIGANPSKAEDAHVHHDIRFLAIGNEEDPLDAQLAEVHSVRWATISDMRDSPDERVRALYEKLERLRVFSRPLS